MLLPVCIIDDFLGAEAAGKLLEFALAHRDEFTPSTVYSKDSDQTVLSDFRASLSLGGDLGDTIAPVRAAFEARADHIRAVTGVRNFGPEMTDLDLVAHCDGHRFRRHIDTVTGERRALAEGVRVLSLVYYLHRTPRRFTGGELVMYPLAGETTQVIEPRHDRLVAFPSIAPHEVMPTSLPGNDFADARFALVFWMMRQTD
jgi:Rps23 Pro-64 3,4-dihydroxylase Tpa1-like proline 4-hydroxylase